ncbi:hypothetical protein BH10CYA1_BH10CYA1_48660 [soil metagenome]
MSPTTVLVLNGIQRFSHSVSYALDPVTATASDNVDNPVKPIQEFRQR